MANRLRVLSAFRDLHRARREVFNGDPKALGEIRTRINQEFRQNSLETSQTKIDELLALAGDVSKLLRVTVVQLREKEDGVYEMRTTKDTSMIENTMFDPFAEIPSRPRRKKCSKPDS